VLFALGCHALFAQSSIAVAQPQAYAPTVREESRTLNAVTLEITFPQLTFDTIGEGLALVPFHGLTFTAAAGEFALPLAIASGTAMVIGQEVREYDLAKALIEGPSNLMGLDRSSYRPQVHNILQFGGSKLESAGRVSGAEVSRLRVGVLAYDRDRSTLRQIVRLRVRINTASISNAAVTDLNGAVKRAQTMRSRSGAKQPSLQSVSEKQGIISDDGKVHKLVIDREGLYKITYDDLKTYGLNPEDIDLPTLRVVNNGVQVPIYTFDKQDGRLNPGDFIEFFGERKLLKYESKFKDMYFDPFTEEAIYYLVWGTRYSPVVKGGIKRMVEESGEVRQGDPSKYVDLRDSSFPAKIHIERKNWYEFLSVTDINEPSFNRDHWYTAEIRRGGSFAIDTQAPYPDGRKNSPLKVRVGLHGFSTFDRGFVDYEGKPVPDVPNEQEASISLNGNLILFDTWDSQQLKFISTDTIAQLATGVAPTTRMLGGWTELAPWRLNFTVQHTKSTDVQSRFGLNWIDIEYDRTYNAWGNELYFSTPRDSRDGFYQFTLNSFTRPDISIYRKGVSKISNVFISAITPGAKQIQCIFQAPVSSPSEEFVAMSDSSKLKPKRYFFDDHLDLRNTSNEGEYLVISDRVFLNKYNTGTQFSVLQRYMQRASAKGIKAKLIDVANIYDEFNGGSLSPVAIRDFLAYAYNYWATPPKYVVLVGRADAVPTPAIQSFRLGSISSDAWYSMIDGDDLLPDIAIGRVPAVDAADAEGYINKVAKYEEDRSGSAMWKNTSLFISGNFALGSDFPAQITDLLNTSMPRSVIADRAGLNLNQPYYTEHDEVIGRFNTGLNYIQFMGHGGHRAWDDYVDGEGRAILIQDDVNEMRNTTGTYPFVTSLTCFTGSFEGGDPGLIPLLVNRREGGAIGGYATSSFGFRDADYRIAESLLPSVFDTLPATWGDRVFRAKTDYYLRYGGFGMLVAQTLQYAYYFLGDPSVSPFVPEEEVFLKLSTRTATPGGQVIVEGETSIQSGVARIELVNEGNSPLPEGEHLIENIPVQNGRFSIADNLPATLTSEAGTYKVTVSSSDGKRFARASTDISFAKPRVTQLEITPRFLVSGQDFQVTAAVQVPGGVSSVTAEIKLFEQSNQGIETQVGTTQTVPMSLSRDRFAANVSGAILRDGMRVEINVNANANGGGVIPSDTMSAVVGASADPAAFASSNHNTFKAKLVATPSGLAWQQRVYNWGSVEARNVKVELVDTKPATKPVLSSIVVPSIAASSYVTVLLPFSSSTLDSAWLQVRVTPEDGSSPLNYRDSSVQNNETSIKRTTLGASAYMGSSGSAATLDGGDVSIQLGSQALFDVAAEAIRIERIHEPMRNVQPDVHLIELKPGPNNSTYGIRVIGDSVGSAVLNDAATRKLSLRVADPRAELKIYRQDDRTKLWTLQPTERNGDILTATISALGTFAIGFTTDKTPPVVEMTVEGQVFVDKGDVPEKPRLSIVVQDANGVDITMGKTLVKIDGQPVQAELVSSLDTQRTQTTINLRLEPTLSNGRHTITVSAVDNNGLQAENQLEVNVSNEFVIQELGVYPNPFATVMFLAYEIKGIPFADEVELNIYTVSGKLIKTHRFPDSDPEKAFGFVKGGTGTPTSLGYHEVWWDGRDNDGVDVANGVYFYRLKVSTSRETKEITGKIARIR
jgi:hypothetical protein